MSEAAPEPAIAPQPRPAIRNELAPIKSAIHSVLYTHNPFYLISTCLLLMGVRLVYGRVEVGQLNCGIMMAVLGGYALLSAGVACLIVKLGSVWDDARSIFVSLLIVFVAISVSADELLMLESQSAIGLILIAYVFAASVTEGMIRGLRIRLAPVYRVPLHLMLAVLCLYPYVCSAEAFGLIMVRERDVLYRILGFPCIFAGALLTLWPAMRLGSPAAANNGTPWKWPAFPWSLFGLLTALAAFRSYIISFCFGPIEGNDVHFAGYFLVPIALAWLFLIAEYGVMHSRRIVVERALQLAPLVMVLPFVGVRDGLSRVFMADLAMHGFSPVFWTAIALTAMFAWFRLRGVREATIGVAGMLLLLTVIQPGTVDSVSFSDPAMWPLCAAGAVLLFEGLLRRSSEMLYVAALLVAFGVACLLPLDTPVATRIAVGFHIVMLAGLLIGVLLKDASARWMLRIAAVQLMLGCGFASQIETLPQVWKLTYIATSAAIMFGIWYFSRERWLLLAGVFGLGAFSVAASQRGLALASNQVGARAVRSIALAVLSFVVALLISLSKAGRLPSAWRQLMKTERTAVNK